LLAFSDGVTQTAATTSERIRSLDALRGAGVLGMLAVHMPLFAYPSLARWNPTAYGDLQGLNWWAWLLTSILADGKFITIFAMLLGVSIAMQPSHRALGSRSPRAGHWRRMAVLLGLGLLHAYVVWYGDMLVPFALCGFLIYPARRLSPAWLLTLGILAFATASMLSFVLTSITAGSNPAALAAWRAQWTPQPAVIAAEITQYRGGWLQQMAHRVPAALETETSHFITHLLWQMTGLMLMGMALFKLGVLSATRSRRFYLTTGSLGFGLGGVLVSLGLWRSYLTNWDLLDFVLISQQLQYWGNLLVALGWTALVMLLVQLGWRLQILATVGRMALTNYLLQSVICTMVFYGHGFGLFGRIDRAAQLAFVIAVWVFQWLASAVWLRYFAVGPVEWLVRLLVFGRRPGVMRPSPVIAGA
jgi:uncharacterized protein